jgi:hypothetical protein
MNFSFQTVVILFAVTVIHIAVIGAISPLSSSAVGFLAEVDVEELVETAISQEPAEADVTVSESETVVAAESDLRVRTEAIPGYPGQPMDELRAQPVEVAVTDESVQSVVAEASPTPAAVAQSQAYSGRVEKPVLSRRMNSDSGKQPEEAAAAVESQKKPASMSPGNHGVREIRPLGRS